MESERRVQVNGRGILSAYAQKDYCFLVSFQIRVCATMVWVYRGSSACLRITLAP